MALPTRHERPIKLGTWDMPEQPEYLDLDVLRSGMPGITSNFGGAMCEAASVCLEDRLHAAGVSMTITGALSSAPLALTWPAATDQARSCYNDLQFAAELGAYGIAILVVDRLTDLTVVERSRKGSGFDYWLGPKGQSEPLFQDKHKLEVSGVLAGDEGDVRRRLREKLNQLRSSLSVKLRLRHCD
jgi:hypothetical protein